MSQSMVYVGLDVHKETIAVALAHQDPPAQVEHLGEIPNRPESIQRLMQRLTARSSCGPATKPGRAATRSIANCGHSTSPATWWLPRWCRFDPVIG
jgi:transposase